MPATRITATELARNLSDILNRVRYRGESFDVLKNGELVAELKPAKKTMTVGEFLKWWDTVPKPDPGFWDDVEEGRRLMNRPPAEPPS